MPVSAIAPDWPDLPPGIQARITTRAGGVSDAPYSSNNLATHVGDQSSAVFTNRQRLISSSPSLRAIQWLNQVHGDEVVEACGGRVIPVADACYSRVPGLAAAVLTADCLPVLLAAADGSQVAAVHAGWRSLAAGILANTLRSFAQPEQVTAYLGPAIGNTEFEIGPEVRQSFAGASDACFSAGEGDRLYADLYQLAREQLAGLGVMSVFGGKECTVTNSQAYFSFRRDGVTGRMASLIWIDR